MSKPGGLSMSNRSDQRGWFQRSTGPVLIAALLSVVAATEAIAIPVQFMMHLPGGFDLSVNGGPLTSSGPILVKGVVDTATPDLDPSAHYGEFSLQSVTFAGAGFAEQAVITPLSLVVFSADGVSTNFAFARTGVFNTAAMGWNQVGSNPAPFMTDTDDLSSLINLPYSTDGGSTFFTHGLGEDAWVLASGDTVGASLGSRGPTGTFSIAVIPEPTTAVLLLVGLIGAAGLRRYKA